MPRKKGTHKKLSLHSERLAVIQSSELCFAYGDGTNVLQNVNCRLYAAKHHAIIGSSGSGKSTLLALIAGRFKPQVGQLEVRGKVATIYQDLWLVAERTAIQNVLHGSLARQSTIRTLFGFPKSEHERAFELLKRVGLQHKVHVQAKFLSGGERQRVAIARALMGDPDILLADEPVAALDEEKATEILVLLSSLAKKQGLTVVTVLHNIGYAERYADTIQQLQMGEMSSGATKVAPTEKTAVVANKKEGKIVQFPLNKTDQESLPAMELQRQAPMSVTAMLSLVLLCLLAYGSAQVLKLGGHSFSGILQGLSIFIEQLFPSSLAEIAAIPWSTLCSALLETLAIAFLGTVGGVALALPLSACAAKQITPWFIRAPLRLLLNAIRTVPSLIWALFFVAAVGLGSLAGVLALSLYSLGYLSKFFYEAFENVDPRPATALQEIGATGLQQFSFAIWPAASSAVLSSCIFMIEYNVRAASILGLVDAGGIGFYMKQYADFRAFPSLLACLSLILVVVVAFDVLSAKLRAKLTARW